MKERNRDTLTHALQQLPQYAPGDALWRGIENALDKQAVIEALPEYAPPPEVWAHIEANLYSPRRIWLNRAKWVAVAAIAVGVGLGLRWMINADAPARITTGYSQDKVAAIEIPAVDAEEEAAFQDIPKQLAVAYLGDQAGEAQRLKTSLEELNGAVEEIRGMLKRYGPDNRMIEQLGDVERERTEVLKQMASLL